MHDPSFHGFLATAVANLSSAVTSGVRAAETSKRVVYGVYETIRGSRSKRRRRVHPCTVANLQQI